MEVAQNLFGLFLHDLFSVVNGIIDLVHARQVVQLGGNFFYA
jgi:hypothetical protein